MRLVFVLLILLRFQEEFVAGSVDFGLLKRNVINVPKNESRIPPKTTHFVIGGTQARAGVFPWQVYILFSAQFGPSLTSICGGSLLSPRHILTAAHCAVDMVAPSFVMVGSVDLEGVTPNTKWREVHTTIVHPNYNRFDDSHQNDIAVLEFSPPITYNADVKPVKFLQNDRVLLWKDGVVSGFGTFKHRPDYFGRQEKVVSRYLLYANVQFVHNDVCKTIYKNPWNQPIISNAQVCAGAAGRGTSQGDSGGPIHIVHNGETFQVGLTSFGTAIVSDMYRQDKFPSEAMRIS
ncbi:hypothetical protein L596_024390 [Steinernema carpocapsae]|uniref:Peptidase S1 domain-containing protein n=1 Tax=Steinernema carpocapsae TaxID=34508 RepID=A0A4U5MGK1_STECR|nr:hypothetical protein L596_024390 [Steinernema carpocapsae]